jgi:PTH1 family peptidyl-tRNA hydrolase
MAWLQKRPQVSNPTTFFTVGLNKTLLIVGLGNPGKQYDQTRHNIGFECIDTFLATFSEMEKPINKKDLHCILSKGQIGDSRVMVIKPTTFMNDSGTAVSKIANFYKIATSSILVVHDDIDIDFGQIRTRVGGSSAGHNGIKSISKALGDQEYGRLRIGINNVQANKMDSKDFVLAKFSDKEKKQVPNLKKEVVAIISEYIYGGGDLLNDTRSFIV